MAHSWALCFVPGLAYFPMGRDWVDETKVKFVPDPLKAAKQLPPFSLLIHKSTQRTAHIVLGERLQQFTGSLLRPLFQTGRAAASRRGRHPPKGEGGSPGPTREGAE